jgi:hypothetical protein
MMIPERINIGTARIGKLSTPASIALMTISGEAGNVESIILGKTAVTPKVVEIGSANRTAIRKNRNNATGDK